MKVEDIQLAFETNIQFAITDDLKAFTNDIELRSKNLNLFWNDYNTARTKIFQEVKSSETTLKNANTTVANFLSKAKELGIDPNSVSEYKNIISKIKNLEGETTTTKSTIK